LEKEDAESFLVK